MLSAEEIQELKDQLSEQIQHLPPDKKVAAQAQIDNMSSQALETMLNQQSSKKPQEILRSIVNGEIPSKKINESKDAIAVLEIKPLSKAHVLIIPKKKVTGEMPKSIVTFAKKVAKKITSKYKPLGIEIIQETKFNEQVINVVPYYKEKLTLQSPRYDAKEIELEEVHKMLKVPVKKEVIRPAKKTTNVLQLKRKIP